MPDCISKLLRLYPQGALIVDLILTNGRFFTADEAAPWANGAVIRDGRIAQMLREEDSLALPAEGLPNYDLGGRLVLPGLIDAHTHPSGVAKSAWHVSLPQTDDVDAILAFIREHGERHPKEEAPYLFFEYYPSTLFAGSAPTKELLDSAISDRPVLCQDFSDHAHWVNSKMLELLEVDEHTPDPVPGLEMFVRDAHGVPTGHILEFAHLRFIDRLYDSIGWRPPEELTAESLKPFFEFMTRHGVTSLFEALIEDEDVLPALRELHRRGELHTRYEGAVRFRTLADLPDAIERAQRLDREHGTDHIRVRTLKLFLDGTNESGNSAVLAPLVHDDSGSLGEMQIETDELVSCLLLANEAEIDVHIHMVGDRAFRAGCDAVAAAKESLAETGGAWRTQVTFAHCELIDPADMHRPAELGIIVNWTNHWSAGYFGEEAKSYLGDERWNRMYDFRGVLQAGASMTFASDVVTNFELHRGNPFFGMQVAATRVDPELPLDPDRYPGSVRPSRESRFEVTALLRGHTIEAARQLRIDDRVGSLEVGKDANLVVLDRDLFDVELDQLGQVSPSAVLFEGELAFGSLT
ncbi:hypothetical protein C5E06_14520 [Pseudoclavibacter sp. RFBI5]|nr:hypothetical protein C5E06_14520 [Pseudoclavibacter sp. RFBI5]